MKIGGADKLARQFRKMPKTVEKRLQKTVKRSTESTARMAKALAPVDTDDLKTGIYTQYDSNGLRGSVEAAAPTKEAQTKAIAVSSGRSTGNRGTTSPAPFLAIARRHLGAKFQRSVKAAIKKGLKEATSG